MKESLKILVIHNFHRKGSASGDDQVFKSETQLLREHGHTVIPFTTENDLFDQAGRLGKLKYTLGMLWSFRYYRAVKKLIREEKPDLVHVHTFFPLLSPSVLYAAKRSGVKVVATLHDTRFVCPCATSLRDGKVCNECLDGHYFRMRKYGCFKGSKLQSFYVAFVFTVHKWRKSFFKQIDRYICLNDTQTALLKKAGYAPEKLEKKYNFVPDPLKGQTEDLSDPANVPFKDLPERYVVFYGRIGEEKGIRELMKIWEKLPGIPLVVMGTGPLDEEFTAFAEGRDNIYFLGYVPRELCLSIVRRGEFVVFPSIWYEGCSMVEIETESLGKTLVATDLGFSAELIREGENGYKVPAGNLDYFADTVLKLWLDPEKAASLGRAARRDYEARFMPETNYEELMNIYQKTLEETAHE